MQQGSRPLSWRVALAVAALAMLAVASPQFGIAEAARKSSTEAQATKAKNNLRQFTGVVRALDKTSLTVEKGGKKPQSRVFTRHAELKVTGELEKDARVTVYYRESGGQVVAHRVVVKPDDEDSPSDR
jgi:hypothetical protein